MEQDNMNESKLIIHPGNPLHGKIGPKGTINLPGDKSLSHRAALLAAMAEGDSQINNFLVAGVTKAMLDALKTLGIPWKLDCNTLSIQGRGLKTWPIDDTKHSTVVCINCGNSATTLRLLAGALAAWGRPAILDGSAGLRRRPMRRIIEPLKQMGVTIETTDGSAPLTILGSHNPLQAIDYTLPVASAQVKSCLLIAALAGEGTTTLREPGPSRDHTERMLRAMGIEVKSEQLSVISDQIYGIRKMEYVTHLTPPHPLSLSPLHMALPVDISAAAFLIVAALITPGSKITLQEVGLNPTRTGLLEALSKMGASLRITNRGERHSEPIGDISIAHSSLQGVRVDGDLVVRMIDEFPALAVAAAYAQGTTMVADADELRNKESDRIAAMGLELQTLGVEATETSDGFIIQGGRSVHGGVVEPHGDHRLAMALAIAGLAAKESVIVKNSEIIHESFPQFCEVLQSLGADLEGGNS
jgi:3-phosphoshikimate 1-carboxyvinyltransferase